MATACAMLKRSSTVMILPLNRTASGAGLLRRRLARRRAAVQRAPKRSTRQDRRDDNRSIPRRIAPPRSAGFVRPTAWDPILGGQDLLEGTVDVYGWVRHRGSVTIDVTTSHVSPLGSVNVSKYSSSEAFSL